MATLHIQNLKKSYGTTPVLKGIDLEFHEGEWVSLLGASGSGKTTALRCIAGLERPDTDSGRIALGESIFSEGSDFMPPEQRRLAMVFQSYAVWPHLTVEENIRFPLEIQFKGQTREIERRAKLALEQVRMVHLASRLPHQLSGGQQQRVAIARAIAVSPRVLLLDEPLSNLDALLREELGAEIRRLQRELKLTTILVTHDQKEALALSDRIVLLNHGKVDCEGSPEALYQKPPTAFCGEFLAQGQRVGERFFLPRLWHEGEGEFGEFKIQSRLYLGREYEYRAQSTALEEPIRFFSKEKHELSTILKLTYTGDL
jgi:ABC-type Fe3+/spermidine/putrescine transport system ATPase subunit